MSELIQKNDNRATIRWKLLTGASALALTAYVSSAGPGRAEDTGQPQLWIELGGQFNRLQDSQEAFNPPFMESRPSIFSPSQKFEKPPSYGFDEFGSLTFQPGGSDWVFSASIRYGRSAANRHVAQQTNPQPAIKYYTNGAVVKTAGGVYPSERLPHAQRFAETLARNSESHSIIDFKAGKDVGLGLLGSSAVSLGVRFAQFQSKSNVSLKSDPDWHFTYKYFTPFIVHLKHISKMPYGEPFHSNEASFSAWRSFHGIGPSISWKASAPFAGNPQNGELTLDWDVQAALLFGRQRAKTHHQSTARYGYVSLLARSALPHTTSRPPPVNHTRSRNVTVPNLGGSVGISFKYDDAKVTFGYRADIFFNAMDGGIDARKNENRAFNGPYASISIGFP